MASEETGGFNIRGYGRFTSEGTGTGGYDIRWYRRVTSEYGRLTSGGYKRATSEGMGGYYDVRGMGGRLQRVLENDVRVHGRC